MTCLYEDCMAAPDVRQKEALVWFSLRAFVLMLISFALQLVRLWQLALFCWTCRQTAVAVPVKENMTWGWY